MLTGETVLMLQMQRVWLVVLLVAVLGPGCQGAIVAVEGLPLVAPGAIGAFPVAALLSLQVSWDPSEKFGSNVKWGY